MSNTSELLSRALLHESEGDLAAARQALDALLQFNPSSQPALDARARIGLLLEEPGAYKHCARALALREDDPELQLQMIRAAVGAVGVEAMPLVETFVAQHSSDVQAHELLAELRAQAGAGDSFADSYLSALKGRPEDEALLMSYWNVLSRAGRYAEALQSMDTNRVWFAGDRAFSLLEVGLATHSGMTDRAGALLASMDDAPEVQLARSEHSLQSGRPDEAARALEAVIAVQPTDLTAWALLEPCWRLLDDARHEWLIGGGRLYGVTALDLDLSDLARIAAKLRELHRAQAQPLGQSIRGGTQTSGDLFGRRGPEISQLQQAVISAAQRFISSLPPADPTHPLLRYRDHSLAFGPSWSVRLAERGFHAPHFHPGGILSSACYISLPAGLPHREERQGWLEIGRPPGELKTDLPPLASFEPKAGDLVLFPSFLFHGTRPFTEGERLTVAFDIVA